MKSQRTTESIAREEQAEATRSETQVIEEAKRIAAENAKADLDGHIAAAEAVAVLPLKRFLLTQPPNEHASKRLCNFLSRLSRARI